MKRVLVLVEGSTEETFVKRILQPFLLEKKICLLVTILNTKEVKDGPNFKGGILAYGKVRKHIHKLIQDSDAVLITTMFDYYGLPLDFPGYATQCGSCHDKVKHLEQQLAKDINNPKFYPYLQLHEFEALLFSSVDIASQVLLADSTKKKLLLQIRESFKTPEEINNNPETCPSKRILKIFPEYTKVLYGSLISGQIGINNIRKECPHFHEWLSKIETV